MLLKKQKLSSYGLVTERIRSMTIGSIAKLRFIMWIPQPTRPHLSGSVKSRGMINIF